MEEDIPPPCRRFCFLFESRLRFVVALTSPLKIILCICQVQAFTRHSQDVLGRTRPDPLDEINQAEVTAVFHF